jgi:CheY-like chemotaxis protein
VSIPVVLLVEDNPMDIDLTREAFQEAGIESDLHLVQDGQAALDYLFGDGAFADRKAHPRPDLVLLDLRLPGIDGLGVLKRIKKTPQLLRIPVVVLTSSRDEKDLASCYDSRANGYLVKPISFEGFLEMIKTVRDYWLSLNIPPPLPSETGFFQDQGDVHE